MDGSPNGTASGPLVDGGLCDSIGSWSGAVVMCERGAISFADKVSNAEAGGAVAAVVYNNVSGGFAGTLGTTITNIPSVTMAQADGQAVVANNLGQTGTVTVEFTQPASGYEPFNGTSMATPHVAAVAALVWSAAPTATVDQIRDAMNQTALDLGASGRDNSFGNGLVQAADAIAFLGGDTGGPTNTAPTVSIDSPADGASFLTTDSITFTGTASDTEDGSLSGSIAWSSDLDGSLGTGASITTGLTAGTHAITATVTDSAGASSSASITITVTEDSGSTDPISLTATGERIRGRHNFTLTWSGATSSNVDIYINGSFYTTTANDGEWSLATNNRGGASYTLQVCEAGTNICSNIAQVIF
jgi:hypothetical protein